MNLRGKLCAILGLLVWVAAVGAEAVPLATHEPTPTVASPSEGKCCFCVYPNPGEQDSEAFHNLCDSCLPVRHPDCDVRASVAAGELRDAIKNASCRGPLNVMNLQHGPAHVEVFNIIEVCQSAYPGCAIKLDDLSCSTFEKEESAQTFISVIRDSLPDGAIVDICGSGSVNKFAGCSFYRTTKRYVVAPALSKERLGLCPRFGDACDHSKDGGKPFPCVDTLGRKMTLTCCPLSAPELGYWGDSHGCKGRGCSEKSCPSFQTCRDGTWRKQECSRDGVCVKFSYACSQVNKVCGRGATGEECVARPSPSATASHS